MKKEISMIRFISILTIIMLVSFSTGRNTAKKLIVNISEPQVAVPGVCAWPLAMALSDGTLLVLGYNQPSHGSLPGDVECWASTDNGRTWNSRGIAAPRPVPESNNVWISAGFSTDGDLLAICGGPQLSPRQILKAQVYRSQDHGYTWEKISSLPEPLIHDHPYVPFGRISAGQDNTLRVLAYTRTGGGFWSCYMLKSTDNGITWDNPVKLDEDTNETATLYLGNGEWIAAARTNGIDGSLQRLILYRSRDDGSSWQKEQLLTEVHNMIPADLIRLADRRILLTFGNRTRDLNGLGIGIRLSEDEGHNWSQPEPLVHLGSGDLGYPSTIQLKDERLVTAYYASYAPYYRPDGSAPIYYKGDDPKGNPGYHLGVIKWNLASTCSTTQDFKK